MPAKEMLAKGEKEVVIQYLRQCSTFWKFGDKTSSWIDVINKGAMPNFGANLQY
jgi:hypothetical protein